MCTSNRARRIAILVVTAALAQVPVVAFAGHKSHLADVDIESLRGELFRANHANWLELTYDVEIENYYRPHRYELVVYLTEGGYPVVDTHGRRVEFVFSLDYATSVHHDEWKFEQRVNVKLPAQAIQDPRHVRLHGVVIDRWSDLELDHKDRSIRYKHNNHRRHIYRRPGGFRPAHSIGHRINHRWHLR